MTLTSFSRSLHYKDSESEPCVHSVSWINRWNLTNVALIHHWERPRGRETWLDVGDLFLVFLYDVLHWHFESQILRKKLVCTLYLEQMVEFYQTDINTSLEQGKEVIRIWCLWSHFQSHYIIRLKVCLVCTFMNHKMEFDLAWYIIWMGKEVIRFWWFKSFQD